MFFPFTCAFSSNRSKNLVLPPLSSFCTHLWLFPQKRKTSKEREGDKFVPRQADRQAGNINKNADGSGK